MGMLDGVRNVVRMHWCAQRKRAVFDNDKEHCDCVERKQLATIDAAEDALLFAAGCANGAITQSGSGMNHGFEFWVDDYTSGHIQFINGRPVFTPEQRAALEEARKCS